MEESVSEKQVITFLIEKHRFLTEDLKKVELALDALGAQYEPYNTIVLKTSNAGNSEPLSSRINLNPLQRNTTYNSYDKIDQKISFALTQRGSGSKEEILEVILKNEPELNKVKFENTLSVRLSFLLKYKLIGAEKEGRNYIYKLSESLT